MDPRKVVGGSRFERGGGEKEGRCRNEVGATWNILNNRIEKPGHPFTWGQVIGNTKKRGELYTGDLERKRGTSLRTLEVKGYFGKGQGRHRKSLRSPLQGIITAEGRIESESPTPIRKGRLGKKKL